MAEHDDSFADSLRRAAGAAYDATVGRVTDAVGDVALDATEGTARAVVADLQPYLIADVIPDIIEGITPHLTETVVPQVVDAITPHLVEVTVPAVVQGATPELVDSLLPELLDRLRPYLESQLVPQVVDALVPHINEVVAPQIVDALTPLISSEVAPQVIDGVMPHVIEDSAPRIISGVLPMIRNEVVPQIMDDIVDDPRVRSLIKEQSQALVLDSLERVRRGLARADDIVDNIVRWVARRPPRPSQTNAPPGRKRVQAGFVTRGVALTLDLTLISFVVGSAVTTLVTLLGRVLSPTPSWVTVGIAVLAFSAAPTYLALCWTWFGRTIGDGIFGARTVRVDTTNRLSLGVALVRAFIGILVLPVWILGMITSPFSSSRQGVLDMWTRSEVNYVARFLWGIDANKVESDAMASQQG
jgi:uncharacterized RDD family membrane protein YckC